MGSLLILDRCTDERWLTEKQKWKAVVHVFCDCISFQSDNYQFMGLFFIGSNCIYSNYKKGEIFDFCNWGIDKGPLADNQGKEIQQLGADSVI